MFTLPLARSEYQELVAVKYGADAANTVGWALRDARGRIYGWHRREAGNPHWDHRDNAFAAFVPDTRRRLYLARIGHAVTATAGIDDLSELLQRARGDVDDTCRPDHGDDSELQDAMFDL